MSVVAGQLFNGNMHNEGVVVVVDSAAQATTSGAMHMVFPDAASAADSASAAAPNATLRGRFVVRRQTRLCGSNDCCGWF